MKIKYGDYVFSIFEDIDYSISLNKVFLVFLALTFAFISFDIRIQNIPRLGNYLVALDPYNFYRMADQIDVYGDILENDTFRAYPFGYDTGTESKTISYAIYGIYKSVSLFNPSFTVLKASQVFPAIATFFSTLLFFWMAILLFKNIFAASISTILLISNSGFLFRTMSGFSDKEPLAIMFIFLTYALLLKKQSKLSYFLAGIGAALMTWSANSHVFLIYPVGFLFVFNTVRGVNSKARFVRYLLFLIPSLFIFLVLEPTYNALMFFDFLILEFGVLYSFIDLILRNYKLKKFDIPSPVLSLFVTIFIGLSFMTLTSGPGFLKSFLFGLVDRIATPFSSGVIATSVSENQPSYFASNWQPIFGYLFYLFYAGSVWLVYDLFKPLKRKERILISLSYAYAFIHIIFSKYSTVPNFFTTTYLVVFPSILIGVLYFYVKLFKEKRLSVLKELDENYFLVLLWFFLGATAARGAIRLMFYFVPVALFFAGFFIKKALESIKRSNVKFWNYYSLIFVLLLVYLSFSSLNNVYAVAPTYGPSTYGDWALSFNWIKDNTAEDSSFIHWWDYGYWIQALGERATVADGGHVQNRYAFEGESADFHIARHLFTAYNYTELETYLTHFGQPDYFYVVSDDVGKYFQMYRIGRGPAFYSTLRLTQTLPNQISEVNASLYDINLVFSPSNGGAPFGEDLYFDDLIFDKDNTFVIAILVPSSSVNNSVRGAPYAVVYNNFYGQKIIPLTFDCVTYEGCFDTGADGLNAGVLLNDDFGYFIPGVIKDTFMTQVYILGRSIPGVNLAWESPSSLYDVNTFSTGAQNIRIYSFDYSVLEDYSFNESSWV